MCESCFDQYVYTCDRCERRMYNEEDTIYWRNDQNDNGFDQCFCENCNSYFDRRVECAVTGEMVDPLTEGLHVYVDVDTGENVIGANYRSYQDNMRRRNQRERDRREEEMRQRGDVEDNTRTGRMVQGIFRNLEPPTRTDRFFAMRDYYTPTPTPPPPPPPVVPNEAWEVPLSDYVYPNDRFRLGSFIQALKDRHNWRLHQCVFDAGTIMVTMIIRDVVGSEHQYVYTYDLPHFITFDEVPQQPNFYGPGSIHDQDPTYVSLEPLDIELEPQNFTMELDEYGNYVANIDIDEMERRMAREMYDNLAAQLRANEDVDIEEGDEQ